MKTIKIIRFLLLGICFFSCDHVIIKPQKKDEKVYLLTPVDRWITPTKNQSFAWSEVLGAENYQLQIVTPSFHDNFNYVLDSLSIGTTINLNLQPGHYEWCVNAIEPGGIRITSDTNTLTIH